MMVGSLFSGIGGIELGLERAGIGRVVWQCEREPAAQAVLRHHWKGVPIYDDICNLRGFDVEPVDVLCGGFPCVDISLAGKGAGLAGARSGLWFEYLRLIRELRPRFVVAENVAALVARGLDVVLGGLAESGYDSLWLPIRASDVGAPHRRERIFIVAWRMEHPDRIGTGRFSGRPFGTQTESRRTGSIHGSDHLRVDVSGSGVADADSQGLERWSLCGHGRADEWAFGADGSEVADSNSVRELQQERSERDIGGRTVDGGSAHEWPPGPTDAAAWGDYITRHPGRVPAVDGKLNPGFVEALMGFPDGWTEPGGKRNARLKMLGNAVVPQCAEVIGHVVNGLAETEVAP